MKLTKLQRYTAYVILLQELKESTNYEYLCEIVRDFKINDHAKWMTKNLKELYDMSDKGFTWFTKRDERGVYICSRTANREIRISALEQCIKETEPK